MALSFFSSPLIAFGCSGEIAVLTTRFMKRLPSRKATSSSMLSPRISSIKKSASRISLLLFRSTAVTLKLNSSRFAVRRRPQTVEAHGIVSVLGDLSQTPKSCVRSVMRNSRVSNHSFSITSLSKKTELLKARCWACRDMQDFVHGLLHLREVFPVLDLCGGHVTAPNLYRLPV